MIKMTSALFQIIILSSGHQLFSAQIISMREKYLGKNVISKHLKNKYIIFFNFFLIIDNTRNDSLGENS